MLLIFGLLKLKKKLKLLVFLTCKICLMTSLTCLTLEIYRQFYDEKYRGVAEVITEPC